PHEPPEARAESLRRLAGDAVHEIDRDVPKPRPPGERQRAEGGFRGVDAAQGAERRGLERLDAEAQAAYAPLEQDRQLLRSEPLGVRLDRELAHAAQIPRPADPGEKPAERRGRKRGGRAPAHVDRPRPAPRPAIRRLRALPFADERREKPFRL